MEINPNKKSENGYFRTQVKLEDGISQYKFRIQSKSPNFALDEWVDVIDPIFVEKHLK